MDNVRYGDEDGKSKKRDFGKRKDGKKDKKDRGYMMFEEADSEEESLVAPDEKDAKAHAKLKKHSKPSFKFVKKEKSYKPKEKEKEEKKKDEKKKEEKMKWKKKRIPAEATDEKPIFGVPLAVAVARNKSCDGVQLPAMFRECIDYIEEFGLMCEGIYRISGVKSKVQALKEAYNKGLPVYLQEYEPNVVAGLIKQFLRELPEPVLTSELTPKFEQASTIKSVKQRVGEFQRLIEQLPVPNRLLLSWVIIHMTHVIAKEKQNKMSVQNISIVLSPTMQISHRVLNILFTYSKILFKDTVIRKYVPPLKPVTSRWSLDLPESPTSLEEELRKQECLLDELHKDVMRIKDTEKEERLWEVQRVVTGLKRKLKLMKKAQNQSPSFARTAAVERHKEALSQTKPEPPNKLNLHVGDEEVDLRPADMQPATAKKPQAPKLNLKNENVSTSKNFAKKVGLKPVGTPTKDTSMDIGDIEMDSSAQSHSQKQRLDSSEIERRESAGGTIPEASQPTQQSQPEVTSQDHKQAVTSLEHKQAENTTESTTENNKKDIKENDAVTKRESSPTQKSEVKAKDLRTTEQEKNITAVKDKSSADGAIKSQTDAETKEMAPTTESVTKQSTKVETGMKSETAAKASKMTEKSKSPSPVLPESSAQISVTKVDVSEETKIESDSKSGEVSHPPDSSVETKAVSVAMDAADILQPQSISAEKADVPPPSSIPPPGGVRADELAAALNQLADMETEEEINQRVMSQFVADFGIEKPAECDEEYEQLLDEYTALMLEEEELTIIGDELRAKIESEQYEVERLDEEISEIRAMREDLYSSDDKSDSSDSDYDEDDDTLLAKLNQLINDNAELQIQNKDLCNKIYQEVQDCLKTKVQIRMLQQKQLESSKNNELDLLL